MTLSEAIRLGAMLRPQRTGGWDDGKRACALLGAALAADVPREWCPDNERFGIDYDALRVRFPILATFQESPTSGVRCDMVTIIASLNDSRKWTREQIADWVEQIEAQQEPQPEVGKQNLTEALR